MAKNSILRKIKTSELKNELSNLLELDLFNRINSPEKDALTPMLWGSFGIGKTSIVKQLAVELNFDLLITLRLNVLTPIDTKGVPSVIEVVYEYLNDKGETVKEVKKRTSFIEPSFIPVDPNKKYLIFFDEVNTAPPLTQSVAYEIAHERTMAGHKLPQKTCVIMAGNRQKDRGVTFDMPLPLANRCVHYEIEADFESWFNDCVNKQIKIHPDIFTFLKMNPEYIHMENIDNYSVEEIPAIPSNRSWTMLNDYILFLESKNIKYTKEHIGQFVGQSVATKYNTIMTYKERIPDLDMLLLTGYDKKLDDIKNNNELSLKYFIIYSLYFKLTTKLFLENDSNLSKDALEIKREEIFKNFIKVCNHITNEDEMLALIVSLMKKSKYSLDFIELLEKTKELSFVKRCKDILKQPA